MAVWTKRTPRDGDGGTLGVERCHVAPCTQRYGPGATAGRCEWIPPGGDESHTPDTDNVLWRAERAHVKGRDRTSLGGPRRNGHRAKYRVATRRLGGSRERYVPGPALAPAPTGNEEDPDRRHGRRGTVYPHPHRGTTARWQAETVHS